MNIGDFIDKFITIALGVLILMCGIKPSMFTKSQAAIEKMKKFKMLFMIAGVILMCIGLLQLLFA